MCHPLAGGKGGTQYQRGVRDLRGGDGGILLSAVGCPLSAGGETIRLQTLDWKRRFEERDLRFEEAAVRYQPPASHLSS